MFDTNAAAIPLPEYPEGMDSGTNLLAVASPVSIDIPNAILAGLLVVPEKSDPACSGIGVEWLDSEHVVLLAANRNLLVVHRIEQASDPFPSFFVPADLLRFRPRPLDRGVCRICLRQGWVTIRDHSAPNIFPEHLRHWRNLLSTGSDSDDGIPQFDLTVLEKLRAARLLLTGDPRTCMRCRQGGPCIDVLKNDAFAVIVRAHERGAETVVPKWAECPPSPVRLPEKLANPKNHHRQT
jgi:hypothetical protein